MIEELVTKRLSELEPRYRSFVESDFASEAATTFVELVGENEGNETVLENAFTLYLLLILSESEAAEFISRNCGINQTDAEAIMIAFTAALPTGLKVMIGGEYRRISGTKTTDLASEIAEVEHEMESLPGLRTMSHDMKEAKQEAIYSSSQDTLLRKEPQNIRSDTSPRWGSEA